MNIDHHPPPGAPSIAAAVAGMLTQAIQPDVIWTVALAALGAWWALPRAETAGLWRALFTYLRLVATASALCWSVTWLIRQRWDIPPSVATPAVAFAIAAGGEAWRGLGAIVMQRLRDVVSSFSIGAGGRQ